MLTFMILIMLLLLAASFPLLVPLLAATLLAFVVFYPALDLVIVIQQMVGGIKPASLVAVPLFIFAADIMTRGYTANRLLDLVLAFVGHVRGGMAITTAVGCTLFGAVSGSTQATVVAMGTPLRPRLLQAGYSDSFACALIINASDIALLIPPSIGMIVYGVVSGTSVGELFVAGVGPGLFILLLFCIYSYIHARRLGLSGTPRAGWRSRIRALARAGWPLGFPVIVVGGIYAGIFSPVEAAAVSVLYALILELFIYRALRWREIPDLAVSTGMITAVVFILVAAGAAFSWLLSFAQIPSLLLDGIPWVDPQAPLSVLLLIVLAFFIGCMFVDPIVVILVLTPVFMPLVEQAGLDPVHVGVLITLQAAIGSATPPFGVDIFTAIAVFKRPYLEIIRGTPPFVVLLLFATAVVVLVPEIALFLRDIAF